MADNSKMAAALLGVPIALSCQGRLIISKHGKSKFKEASGLTKYTIAGVAVSDLDLSQANGQFNMLECEVIIVPKIIHKEFLRGRGYTIGQMLTGGYHDPENYKTHEGIVAGKEDKNG